MHGKKHLLVTKLNLADIFSNRLNGNELNPKKKGNLTSRVSKEMKPCKKDDTNTLIQFNKEDKIDIYFDLLKKSELEALDKKSM